MEFISFLLSSKEQFYPQEICLKLLEWKTDYSFRTVRLVYPPQFCIGSSEGWVLHIYSSWFIVSGVCRNWNMRKKHGKPCMKRESRSIKKWKCKSLSQVSSCSYTVYCQYKCFFILIGSSLHHFLKEKVLIKCSRMLYWRFHYSGKWCCVAGQVVVDIARDCSAFLLGLLDPEHGRYCDPLKHQELLTQWHNCNTERTSTTVLWEHQIFRVMRREENQLDVTERFIAIVICSTCFRHLYAHHQELETILVLLPHMVCNAVRMKRYN